MSDNYPNFCWQREMKRKWINFSLAECVLINKAIARNQKTVTLPTTEPSKKVIYLEKMCQKNSVSGYEQRIRCLIFNGDYFCWSWQDDYGDFISYTPRIAFYLEVVYIKKLEKVNIFLKDEYEINLIEMTQRNKVTNYVRPINHTKIELAYPKEDPKELYSLMISNCKGVDVIKKFSSQSEESLKNILFGQPPSGPVSSSSSVELPSNQDIITALNAEIQSSNSPCNTSVDVDPDCPEYKKWDVYSQDSNVYNATLNLTNVQDNNNKYFIIQLLKFRNKKRLRFAVWLHWGRVGYKGQNNMIDFGSNLDEAKKVFEKKFYEKTHNQWAERNNFERVPNKYDLLHISPFSEVPRPLVTAETKLDKRVQELLQIICNQKNLEDAAKEMSYDSTATPLGKITAKQILEGYAALKNVSDILKDKGVGKEFIEACNVFYTKIPHDFGRKKPPLLNSTELIAGKMKMLEDLSNICFGMDVLNSKPDGCESLIDKYYKSLECNIVHIDRASEEFNVLEQCLIDTSGPTHASYSMELVEAFRCEKESQNNNFEDHGNKRLLWHGSRISNWIGILKKGLQIAPKEAPCTGYMFGKGIYFADCSTKSANYCLPTKRQREGLLLLSEVSLGTSLNVHHATNFIDLPSCFMSVWGTGKHQPKSFERTILSPDAALPCGPLQTNDIEDLSLVYNEYVVYNICQVKMKYLLRIKFHF